MFVVTASIHVKPEHIARFIEALLDDTGFGKEDLGGKERDAAAWRAEQEEQLGRRREV
jgi:hypothetical protein